MSSSFASFSDAVNCSRSCLLLFRRRRCGDTMNTDCHEKTEVNTSLFFVKVKIKVEQKE